MTETIARNATEFVSFDVAGLRFCFDVVSVREIRGWIKATPIPHAPGFVRGIINLRGAVLPVIDLAARLGFAITEPTARSAVIVAELPGQIVGILVDAVADIINVSPDDIQPTPQVASSMTRDFLRGVIADDKGMIAVLKVDKLAPSEVLDTAPERS
jgi:purine-binding chemotaxis protein CheW